MTDPTESGYAQLGDLRMYYEQHGVRADGGEPLVLLHGGLFDLEQQFGALLPRLAENRLVVAVDFQGHGRTNDIDRPFGSAAFAGDVIGVLELLGIERADVFGFSVGGAVAIELAVRHPDRVRRLVASSVSFRATGMRGHDNADAVGSMTVDMIAGTPMEQAYLAKSPHPDREHLQRLLDKLGATYTGGFPDWSEDDIRGIAAPTLITVGDADMVSLDHAVEFLRLRGGDVNGDFDGLPASQLAVFPGTTHFFGLAHTELVLAAVLPFLDAQDAGPAAVDTDGAEA
jgi:pimeloyl-ACP methyl ester carboxylesterase